MDNAASQTSVRLSESTLAWVGSDYGSCYMTFVPDSPIASDELIAAVADAAHVAEQRTPLAVRVVVLIGVEAVHLRLAYDGLTSQREVRKWVLAWGEALAAAGVSGVARRPRSQYPPPAVLKAWQATCAMTVFCAGRKDSDTSVMGRLAESVELETLDSHDVAAPGFRVRTPFQSGDCSSFALLDDAFRVTGWSDEPFTQASIGFLGAREWDARSSRGDWIQRTERARTGMTALAADLHHAWAELVNGFQTWGDGPRHHPEGIGAGIYRQHEVLWPRRVVDAHGLQVLTSEHLDRATSLDGWRTQQVGDRYLVEAQDLEPWYAADEPDAEVLDRARADFGSMIVTASELDVIRAAKQQEQS